MAEFEFPNDDAMVAGLPHVSEKLERQLQPVVSAREPVHCSLVYSMLSALVGNAIWDGLVTPSGFTGTRILFGGSWQTDSPRIYALIDRQGRVFVEGSVPEDPERRAAYEACISELHEAAERSQDDLPFPVIAFDDLVSFLMAPMDGKPTVH